jgi:UDP-glucose-4-epimerase GalE
VQSGHEAIVLDDLSTGRRVLAERAGGELIVGDCGHPALLDQIFSLRPFDAVIHVAGKALVSESVDDPAPYFYVNVAAGRELLEAARRHGVDRFVFSSTAAVYGVPEVQPISERTVCNPVNPYGASKRAFEHILFSYMQAYELKAVALRYFNVAGASAEADLGELHDPETHLLPNLLRAAAAGEPFRLFGTNYPTRDGSAERDYLHVEDLARAHVQAVERLDIIDPLGFGGAINLGTGQGTTVREVLAAVEAELGTSVQAQELPRRPGDPPVLVADPSLARRVLGFHCEHDLGSMIRSARAFAQAEAARSGPAERTLPASGGAMGTNGRRKRRFGEVAISRGFLEPAQVERALAVQRDRDGVGESHTLLGLILLEMGAPLLPLALACGCAASDEEHQREIKAYQFEIQRLRSLHEEETGDLRRELELSKEEAEAREREVDRVRREVVAVRASHKAERASLDAALARLRQREQQMAELKAQLAANPEGSQAAELLRQMARKNKALQDELVAKAAAEGGSAPKADLSGYIRPSHFDLEVPVAWVDGAPLRRRDFVEFLYLDVGSTGFLDLFINRALLLREAERRGLEASDVDVATWVSEQVIAQTQQAGGAEAYEKLLAERGFDHRSWEARLRYQARPAILMVRMVEMDRLTPSGRELWEARLQAAYREAYSGSVTARHIFVPLDAQATPEEVQAASRIMDSAKRELAKGIPFAEVALRYSRDAKSRALGGTLGSFDRERFAELPNLNAAFFQLEEGKLAGPIRSRIGLHLVQVDEREAPAMRFSQVRRKLEARLRGEPPAEAEIAALLLRIREGAQIKTNLVFEDDD